MIKHQNATRRYFLKSALVLMPTALVTSTGQADEDLSLPRDMATDLPATAWERGTNAEINIDSPRDVQKVIRKLGVYRGGPSSAQKQGPPSAKQPSQKVISYASEPDFALIETEQPLPGFCPLVHDIRRTGTTTYLRFHFRLASPKLRAACRAVIETEASEQKFLDHVRQLTGAGPLVEVQDYPVVEVYIVLRDGVSGVTLSSRREITRLGPDELAIWMSFTPGCLAHFLDAQELGDLEFTPIYLYGGQRIDTVAQTTTVDSNTALKAKQLLSSEQLTKQKHGDETIEPILQGHVNSITRQLATDVYQDVYVSDPLLLTEVRSDALLIGTIFDPGRWMDFAAFRNAFPDFDLAAYLRPHLRTTSKSGGSLSLKSKGASEQTASSVSGGLGFSFLGVGAQAEATSGRSQIETLQNTTGTDFRWDESSQSFVPFRIRVFRLAAGEDDRRVVQHRRVQVAQGASQTYLIPAPIPQWYCTEVVDASLERYIADHADRETRQGLEKSVGDSEKRIVHLSQRDDDLAAEIKKLDAELLAVEAQLRHREAEFRQALPASQSHLIDGVNKALLERKAQMVAHRAALVKARSQLTRDVAVTSEQKTELLRRIDELDARITQFARRFEIQHRR